MMSAPRPRLQIMSITDQAAERVKHILQVSDRPLIGVRVGVKKGGCAGMEYTLDYAEDIRPADEVIEDKGVKILIDPAAVMFLIGTVMDFESTKLSSRFVFRNPNEVSACGCGESVSLEPAKMSS